MPLSIAVTPWLRLLLLIIMAIGVEGAAPALVQPETRAGALPADAPRVASRRPIAESYRSGERGGEASVAGRRTIGTAARRRRNGRRLIESPTSTTVVDRAKLSERNVQTLEQALAYTPEASLDVSGYDPRGDAVDIRGFDVTYNGIYRDGLRQSAVNLAIPRIEPYGAESVTVLRGPTVGIYGSGAPGGIVAVTSKRPPFEPSGEIQLQGGNFGRRQGNVDIGGPVDGSEGTMAYRLTGLVRQSDTFLPGAPDDRAYIAPAFTWKPDSNTSLTVLGEYLHTRLPSNPSFFYLPNYVVSRVYQGDPAFGTYRQDQFRIGYAFEHRFSPDLVLRQNARYSGLANDFPAVFRDRPIVPGSTFASRSALLSREALSSFAVDNQVEGRIESGPLAHTLIAGADYTHYDYDRRFGSSVAPELDLETGTAVRPVVQPPRIDRRVTQTLDQVGVYVQEQAKWDRLILTLAGRQDWLSSPTTYEGPSRTDASVIVDNRRSQNAAAFTYRAGLNLLLTPDLVPYASYAAVFAPQPGTDPIGDPLSPAYGDQLEAGIKFANDDKSITGSVSGFDINQSSNSARNLETTLFFQYVGGSVNARGVEAEMTAAIAPGINLTLAYRHLDFRFVRATTTRNEVLDGNAPAAIPTDTFAAFGSYLFPASSPLSGLTLGGGVRFIGASFADDFNTARNPTATLFDALVAYDLAAIDPRYKGFRAQINGFNIFDRAYSSCQTLLCYRGAPATVIGSLVYRW